MEDKPSRLPSEAQRKRGPHAEIAKDAEGSSVAGDIYLLVRSQLWVRAIRCRS